MGATLRVLTSCLLGTIASCGGDDLTCPAGTVARGDRCVASATDAGATDDAGPDCSRGEGVGGACEDDTVCPCGPCVTLEPGRRVCTSPCGDGQACLAGWDCRDDGLCGCAAVDETCNLRDDDCDGAIDDDASDAPPWFPDTDGDGFGDEGSPVTACDAPEDTVATGGDCDDGSADRYPAAPEICDGLDDDCDQIVPPDEVDGDDDGAPACADCADDDPSRHPGAAEACNGIDDDCDGEIPVNERDVDGDGASECAGDCADEDATRHPGAVEICNGVDDDCVDGIPADEVDGDGDGWAICGGDCADDDVARHPGAAEACNGVDDDCANGVPADEADGDGDGFRVCEGDCADGDPARHPGALEVCNGLDDDCVDGLPPDEADADGDLVRICEGDCLDDQPDVFPGQDEWFPVDRGDGSFDYDCDDQETREHTRGGCRPDLQGGCFIEYWCTNEIPDCGVLGEVGVDCDGCVAHCIAALTPHRCH